MSSTAFITALGKFLPGEPVGNDQMEEHLGRIGGKPSRLRARILRQNGIQSRHYAIDREGRVRYSNCELAANAVRDALGRSELGLRDVEYLAAATSQGDLMAPGFASMVHGELKLPPCEIATLHGVCTSGVMALKSAYLGIRAGERGNAVACASEFASRFFRPGLFEGTRDYQRDRRIPFDAEFLRWMLSDGAGAALLEPRPNARGLSLRVEWIDLVSYADRFDVCMYAGAVKGEDGQMTSWSNYPTVCEAVASGAILLRQDLETLDNVVKLGVGRYFELIEAGRIRPQEIDWMLCHYSSHFFRDKIFELLRQGGAMIPEERWFTNLYSKGNTGSASLFIMLEELMNEGRLQPGQKILCMVPESSRFLVSFLLLTAVTASDYENQSAVEQHDVAAKANGAATAGTSPSVRNTQALQAELTRRLAQVWIDFEGRLAQVPIVDKMNRGKMRPEDYRLLLLNLRQQVVEGGRWIARAASNITADSFPLRSMFIGHAHEEHRDFQMIERDYVSVGGQLEDIQQGEKNIGSEALSAWMFHRSGQENPFDLMGAMFIIEGLGMRLARPWGEKIREQLDLRNDQVTFLLYHGEHDEDHFAKLEQALASGLLTPELVDRIVKTARVTARLYILQLEELGNT
ncbi:MAG: StlD/DarB family beta-ketosynthase [Acidobacteria bacterium]|nr:StlD/DarB family beta-ketosynthase [Acidobacteriota bacterium]